MRAATPGRRDRDQLDEHTLTSHGDSFDSSSRRRTSDSDPAAVQPPSVGMTSHMGAGHWVFAGASHRPAATVIDVALELVTEGSKACNRASSWR